MSGKTNLCTTDGQHQKGKIQDGQLQVGDRLVSEREMSEQYGINRMTVRNALKKTTRRRGY